MKKEIILSVFLSILIAFMLNTTIQAQALKGNLVEETSKEPISFASLALYQVKDSSMVIGVISDAEGKFSFEKVPDGMYYLEINMMGYERKSISGVEIRKGKSAMAFDNLTVKEAKVKLEEVVVEAKRELVEQTESGTVVNASANLTQTGGTVVDLLKNVPGVIVDSDGNVTIRGTSANILIDGHNSSLSNNLLQIPASSVDNIEIINSPSAKYDATGEGGVINIRLKKNKKQGLNGSISASAGTQNIYSNSLRLNYKTQKVNFFGGVDSRWDNRLGYNNGQRTTNIGPLSQSLNQYTGSTSYNQSYNILGGVDIELSPKTRISWEGIYNYSKDLDYDGLNTNFYDNNTNLYTAKNHRDTKGFGESLLMESTLSFKHAFKQKGQELTGYYTFSNNSRINNSDVSITYNDPVSDAVTGTGQQIIFNNAPYQLNVGQLDFAQPINGDKFALEAGLKYTARSINTQSGIRTLDNSSQLFNTTYSNKFDYNEQVQAAYFLLKGKIDKWSYNLGLRLERTQATGLSDFDNTRFNKEYINYFPNLRLNYQLDKANSFRISYSARINRPSTGSLNPYRDATDPLNIRTGNPNLNPEIIHALEFNYGLTLEKFTFSPTAFYRYRDNAIQRIVTVNGDTATYLTQNLGFALTYGAELLSTYQANKWWDMSMNFSLFQNVLQGLGSTTTNEIRSNTAWTMRYVNNFTMFKDLKLQVIGNYASPQVTAQGQLIERYFIDMGLQKSILKKNGKIGIVATDVFNWLKFGFSSSGDNFTQSRVFKRNTQRVTISFTYQFGKPLQDKRRRSVGDEYRDE